MDALALDGDEGRGYLRKASVRGKHPLTRGSPNGGTLSGKPGQLPAESIGGLEPTQGSEPSQYLEEKKATAIPSVAASESGTAQTQSSFEISDLRSQRRAGGCRARAGVEPESYQSSSQPSDLEKSATECDSHVGEGGLDSCMRS